MESGTTPAFPTVNDPDVFHGMDLRTYIATHAMAGLLAGDVEGDFCTDHRVPAWTAVKMADALIAELNK